MRLVAVTICGFLAFAVMSILENRAEIVRLALVDTLTGLPNRRILDDRLRHALSRHGRGGNGQLSIAFFDLDGFKLVNDKYGHRAGDALLIEIARRIRESVRSGDTIARWGGDELVVMMEETSRQQAKALVERLCRIIEQPVQHDNVSLRVGVSTGLACFPDDGSDAESLLRLADSRMYQDKIERRSRVSAGRPPAA